MEKLFIVVLIAIGVYGYIQNNPDVISTLTEESIQSDNSVADAYQNQLSDIQVSGSGDVSRILSDDNKGRRHQRFILRLSSGQTLLVAHNIDLAPKISTLKNGDEVQFFGEYEWNSKGGVIHWTHHDPGGRHIGGWLKHNGRKYE
jgi:molybdopterin converting factor small subunit